MKLKTIEAAAPEMHAALSDALENITSPDYGDGVSAATLTKIRKALAKAELPAVELSPAQKLRAGRCLANVQRLQSEFWQSLRDLESALEDIVGEKVEMDGSRDFNDLNLEDVLAGHANDGGGL